MCAPAAKQTQARRAACTCPQQQRQQYRSGTSTACTPPHSEGLSADAPFSTWLHDVAVLHGEVSLAQRCTRASGRRMQGLAQRFNKADMLAPLKTSAEHEQAAAALACLLECAATAPTHHAPSAARVLNQLVGITANARSARVLCASSALRASVESALAFLHNASTLSAASACDASWARENGPSAQRQYGKHVQLMVRVQARFCIPHEPFWQRFEDWLLVHGAAALGADIAETVLNADCALRRQHAGLSAPAAGQLICLILSPGEERSAGRVVAVLQHMSAWTAAEQHDVPVEAQHELLKAVAAQTWNVSARVLVSYAQHLVHVLRTCVAHNVRAAHMAKLRAALTAKLSKHPGSEAVALNPQLIAALHELGMFTGASGQAPLLEALAAVAETRSAPLRHLTAVAEAFAQCEGASSGQQARVGAALLRTAQSASLYPELVVHLLRLVGTGVLPSEDDAAGACAIARRMLDKMPADAKAQVADACAARPHAACAALRKQAQEHLCWHGTPRHSAWQLLTRHGHVSPMHVRRCADENPARARSLAEHAASDPRSLPAGEASATLCTAAYLGTQLRSAQMCELIAAATAFDASVTAQHVLSTWQAINHTEEVWLDRHQQVSLWQAWPVQHPSSNGAAPAGAVPLPLLRMLRATPRAVAAVQSAHAGALVDAAKGLAQVLQWPNFADTAACKPELYAACSAVYAAIERHVHHIPISKGAGIMTYCSTIEIKLLPAGPVTWVAPLLQRVLHRLTLNAMRNIAHCVQDFTARAHIPDELRSALASRLLTIGTATSNIRAICDAVHLLPAGAKLDSALAEALAHGGGTEARRCAVAALTHAVACHRGDAVPHEAAAEVLQRLENDPDLPRHIDLVVRTLHELAHTSLSQYH